MYNFLSQFLHPFIVFSNLITILFVTFFILYFIFKKKIFKFFLNIIIGIFFIFCTLPVGYYAFHYLEKDFINQEKFQNIDNIIILSGSENPALTAITKKINLNNSSERLIEATKLINNNLNSKIFFLGGASTYKNNNESDVAKIYFENIGFDIQKVRFIATSKNTIENLKDLKNVVDNDQTNLIITSAFHMKRTIIISKKLGIDFIPYPVDHRSIILKDNKIINIYKDFDIAKNINMFNIFFREILGILAVKIFV